MTLGLWLSFYLKVMYLNTAKIEYPACIILFLEVNKEFLVVYFPAQTLFSSIK